VRSAAFALALVAACSLGTPAGAQSNNDDYTPLNSRIKRDRQFPTDIVNRWRNETSAVSRARSRAMLGQFSRCIYNRSRQGSVDLLQKTDYGFVQFEQIGLDNDRALRNYGFMDCLSRVASTNGTGVQLRFSAGALRQWLIQEAYFARYEDEPGWVQAGNVIGSRDYPLSAEHAGVRAAMDFADCVVAADPYTADFFFRTAAGSTEEKRAIEALTPALGPCLPQGQQLGLSPYLLRVWLGEGLWQAATHSAPAPAGAAPQEAAE
jgi:hypothetical protein